MTYKQWEKQLKRQLSSLSASERADALEYYRELYGDKKEAGGTEDAIVAEFGAPEDCAKRILTEGDFGDNGNSSKQKKGLFGGYSPAQIVGIVFLTIIILCPLAEVALAVVAAFAVAEIAGGVVAVAGVVYIPLCLSFGVGFGGTLAHIGVGIAACGVGLLVLELFYYATKYTVIGCVKGIKYLYKLR